MTDLFPSSGQPHTPYWLVCPRHSRNKFTTWKTALTPLSRTIHHRRTYTSSRLRTTATTTLPHTMTNPDQRVRPCPSSAPSVVCFPSANVVDPPSLRFLPRTNLNSKPTWQRLHRFCVAPYLQVVTTVSSSPLGTMALSPPMSHPIHRLRSVPPCGTIPMPRGPYRPP